MIILNASKLSEHPIKAFRWEHIGCQGKISSWHLIGFPDGSNMGSTI